MKSLISLFLLIPVLSLAQVRLISGRVLNKNNSPIKNANVFIEGTYDGANTDSLGYFTFTATDKDTLLIKASTIGFISKTIHQKIDGNIIIDFILETDNKLIDEVIIQAGQFRVGNLSKSVMSPLDIVTTAGSNGNIVSALEKLPGAQIAGENGRLMVRGGLPHETQTYINGIRVSQPYTNTSNGVPVRGRFSPYLFKGTNFSTGGYSAEFGNALSSILNLTTGQEIDQAKTDISISNITLGLSNTQRKENTSLSINVGYTNLKPYSEIIPQKMTWTKPYEQLSGEAIIKNKGKNHFFNLYGSYAFEKMGVVDYDIDFDKDIITKIQSNNVYFNSNYIQYLPQNWKIESGASYGYANRNTLYHIYTIPNSEYHIHIKSKAIKRSNSNLQYTFGAEYFLDKLNESVSTENNNTIAYGYKQKMASAFSTIQFKIGKNLFAETGLRYTDDFQFNRKIDPRANLAYQINNNQQISLAYGIFHQNANEDVLKFKDNLPWSKAEHLILNYNYSAKGRHLRMEVFHKKYQNLIQYNSLTPTYNSTYNTNGHGKAQGIDIYWKDDKSIRNLQYWVSYSLTDVNKIEQNYPISVQPNYVAKHYFSIVAKYWISNWRSQVGLTNTFSSGRPYNNPNHVDFMDSQTKNRNDLSWNWSYLLTQQKILHISITNLLGQNPIYGYKFSRTINNQGLYSSQTITPTAKRFLFIGFFWTISKNKKENNLNNL